jgi:hypothetical protein
MTGSRRTIRRRTERPLADEARVLAYDLLEVGEMADPAWSLGTVLAHCPGWTGRGMREVTR